MPVMISQNSPKLLLIPIPGSTSVAKRNKFSFTKKTIEALPLPRNGQRSYFYDSAIRGLAVAVSPLGKKTYILYRKIAGRPERVMIGPCADLSIEQARKRADEMNGAIALGANPAAKRRTVRDEMTVGELFQTFLDSYAKEHKKRWKDDEAMFKLHLNGWRLHKISSIRKADVIAIHSKIGRTRGRYVANRVVELLCAMFNRARSDWGWEGENPASGVKAFKERKRGRFLQAEEMTGFFKSLNIEPNGTIRDYVYVSLLTGGRRANVQAMRWSEISWPRATWTVPAEKSKNDEAMDIVLPPLVVRILKGRKARSKSEWVFPGRGRSGHLVSPKNAWKRILARAKLQDLRLHDLRRTLGSWQADTGASLPIIGETLGHKSASATQVYARLSRSPVRLAVNKAVDAMLLAGGLSDPTKSDDE